MCAYVFTLNIIFVRKLKFPAMTELQKKKNKMKIKYIAKYCFIL